MVTISMTTAVRIEITVSAGFRMIMVTRVAAMEISELMIWGMLWLNSCRRVSTSLV